MKRSVCLKSNAPAMSDFDTDTIKRVAGHLLARMQELSEIGLTAEGKPEAGVVKIRFTGRDNREAAEWLERKRKIETDYQPDEDLLCMLVTDGVTFEDMDYVQGAVTELLL